MASALVFRPTSWAFYVFGCVVWLLLAFNTLFIGWRSARRIKSVSRDHTGLAVSINILWLLYVPSVCRGGDLGAGWEKVRLGYPLTNKALRFGKYPLPRVRGETRALSRLATNKDSDCFDISNGQRALASA